MYLIMVVGFVPYNAQQVLLPYIVCTVGKFNAQVVSTIQLPGASSTPHQPNQYIFFEKKKFGVVVVVAVVGGGTQQHSTDTRTWLDLSWACYSREYDVYTSCVDKIYSSINLSLYLGR